MVMVVWRNTVLQCGKKWAWPSKHFLICAACGLLPPRSKNPSYAPADHFRVCCKLYFVCPFKL